MLRLSISAGIKRLLVYGTEEEGDRHFGRQEDDNYALATMPPQNQANTKGVEIEEVANGQFEVQLESIGVPPEDIVAY